jgi:hypothetical protein
MNTFITKARELREKATQGEWYATTAANLFTFVRSRKNNGDTDSPVCELAALCGDLPATAEFIAFAANNFEKMLKVIEIQRDLIERLHATARENRHTPISSLAVLSECERAQKEADRILGDEVNEKRIY